MAKKKACGEVGDFPVRCGTAIAVRVVVSRQSILVEIAPYGRAIVDQTRGQGGPRPKPSETLKLSVWSHWIFRAEESA